MKLVNNNSCEEKKRTIIIYGTTTENYFDLFVFIYLFFKFFGLRGQTIVPTFSINYTCGFGTQYFQSYKALGFLSLSLLNEN